ncbi:MAG TPA: iron-containing alcohol dehydrogenase [Pseudonocardiaceae bacterium]|jgi:glycerol-1-phosphate dehydrogenase [NAD(P)+]|nr:iron-containing alcohol dehydrogenase [Pseudonocardiaceae bacterium]
MWTDGGFDLTAIRATLAGAPEAARLRPLGLGAVITGEGALDRLPAMMLDLVGTGPVAVLGDTVRIEHRGVNLTSYVRSLLAGNHPVDVTPLGQRGRHRAYADEATVERAVRGVAGAAAVVSVGSGTIADIGKVAAAAGGGLPHVIVQTAASVNGFADDRSVLLIDGVKRTVPSRWPDVLLIDPEIIAAAPPAMNLAGVGDLLAMYTAPADWYLASAIGVDESFAPSLVELVRPHGQRLLDIAGDIAIGAPAAVGELASLLTLSGITMGVAGATAVSSGMEHAVSHLIEMAVPGGDTRLHGAQVGAATVIAARTWRHVRDVVDAGRFVPRLPDPDVQLARIETRFARLGDAAVFECWQSYRRKIIWLAAHPNTVTDLLDHWDAHAAVLDKLLVDPDRLAAALATAGVPSRFGELDPPVDAASVHWAVANCHLMRERFGVADLADLLGVWDDDDVDGVLSPSNVVGRWP